MRQNVYTVNLCKHFNKMHKDYDFLQVNEWKLKQMGSLEWALFYTFHIKGKQLSTFVLV